MKKLIASLTLFVASTTLAFAMMSPAPYIGAGVGIHVNTGTDSSVLPGFRGSPLSLVAGYGGSMSDCYYLAGELNAVLLTGSLSGDGLLKSTYSYGFSVLPGYYLGLRTFSFLRMGVVRTRFSTAGESSTGGLMGLGMQTGITQNLDVRGEYDFVAYSAFNTYAGSVAPRQDGAMLSLVYKFD